MKIHLLILISSFFAWHLNAQNNDHHEWRTLQNQGENFRTIQQLMQVKYAEKSSNKKASNYSRPYKQYKRWEQYWESQVDEKGNFVSAQQTWEEAIKLKQKNTTRSPFSAANWSIIGPVNIPQSSILLTGGMGRINCVTWETGNTNNLYVGSPSGGLWKSTNGGNSWIPLTDHQITLGVNDIVVSYDNPNIIYLATGDADGQQNSSVGILKSTDGGSSWNQTGLVYNKSAIEQTASIVQNPTHSNTLLVAGTGGIQKTIDGGATWSVVQSQAAHDLEYDPNNPMIMYASGSGVIWKSTNGGNSWLDISPNGLTGKIELALTIASNNYILALDKQGLLMQSTNGGASWSNISSFSNILFESQAGYNLSLAISPIDPNLIMVGGTNGWRSTNGGASWDNYLNGYWNTGDPYFYLHPDHHVFKFLPNSNIMFTGSDGGLHKGDASLSVPWTDLSSGLAITQYYGLSADPIDANQIIAGPQDQPVSQYDGTTWSQRGYPADGIDGLIDPMNPTMIQYASNQSGLLTRTDDGWATSKEISPTYNCGFIWPMRLDPITSTTLYAGCAEIHKSTDKGDTWTTITNNQSIGFPFTELAIAPSNPNVIYAAYGSNHLIRTQDGGNTWSPLTTPSIFQKLTGIAIDPTNPHKIWITYGGYTATGKVFRSNNWGNSWINVTGTLPNIPVKCIIAQSGAINGDLYIGTDLGVFYTNNTLSDWQAYNTGLPNVIVNDLEITYSTGKLRAATFGRGIWESDLNTIPSSISPTNKGTLNWTVLPNPSKGFVELNISDKSAMKDYTITIYNLIGGVVYHRKNLPIGQHKIDLSAYNNGIYLLTLATQNSMETKRITIAK